MDEDGGLRPRGVEGLLLQSGLYQAVRAVQYGISLSHFHFFAMLERYNRTLAHSLPKWRDGLALHEMYEVFGLRMGDLQYEENISGTEELHLMKKDARWFMIPIGKCHFHICAQITRLRARGIKQMSWVSYLFKGLGNKIGPVSRRAASTDEEIKERIFTLVSS